MRDSGPITLTPAEVGQYIRVRLPDLRKSGAEYRGPCPVHGGKGPNFSINSEDGLSKCHSKCDGRGWDVFSLEEAMTGADFRAAKVAVFDLVGRVESPYNVSPTPRATKALPVPLGPVVATYNYTNEAGDVVHKVVRHCDPKTFRQYRPDGRAGWIPNLSGVTPVPYRLPELIESGKVFVVEGEKDADNLARLGLTATCNSGGAGNFKPELVCHFKGKHVVILPDNDEPGMKHAEAVARLLAPVAASVRVVALPGLAEKGDVSDWVDAGGTEAQLRALVRATPVWEASTVPEPEATPERPGIRCIEDIRAVSLYASQRIDWAVHEFIPEAAITLISGDSGSGKTTVVDAICDDIASGTSFAGLPTLKRPALILDRENPAAGVLERRLRIGVDGDNPNVRTWGGWCEDEPCEPASPIITAWVQSCNPKPVIVIDSFVAFAQCDENSATEVRAFMQALRRLADMGATIILIHHSGKGESSRDFRGSSDIKAAVDVAYHVSNLGDASRLTTLRLRAFKARFSVLPELLLHYTEGAGFRMDDRQPYQATGDVLRELLIENPRITASEFEGLAAAKGIASQKSRQFLTRGIDAGTVRSEKGLRNSRHHFWAGHLEAES